MRNLIRALIAALSLVALPVVSQAGLSVGVSVDIAPPVLPVYVQPPCPAPGYIWMPGYWAWDDGYYWVPGTWVLAPTVGLLWTPGYWGWGEGAYVWHAGYWGPHVGFYGGINYGFGYGGVGYQGGYWRGHEFYYNRSVTNINTTNITNVYNRTVVNNVNVTRVSFNGGAGGVVARPTAAEVSAQHERHLESTPVQRQQQQLAERNSSLRATANGGQPAIAATPKAGVFSGHGVVAARGAEHAGGAPRTTAEPARESAPAARNEHTQSDKTRDFPGAPAQRASPNAGAQRSERPATVQHAPATVQHAPATAQHAPATAQHAPTTVQHAPATVQHAPATAQHAPATVQHAPATAQHAPVRESAPAHAPQPQHYASVQSNSRGSPFEHEARAETAQPAPQHSVRPEPQHQTRPEPQHQPRPEHSQPQPAPQHQPAAAQGAGRAGHQAERPEHGGGP